MAHGFRTGGEVKGKQANGVGSQYNSTLPRNVVCPALLPLLLLIRTPRLPVVDWTDAPNDLNGLVLFGERQILVSARVPSRSARAINKLSVSTLHGAPSVVHSITFFPICHPGVFLLAHIISLLSVTHTKYSIMQTKIAPVSQFALYCIWCVCVCVCVCDW